MRLVDEAESLLLYQFKDAPKLKNLIRSLVMPLETIVEDIEALGDGLHIDEASGHLLDMLGRIIGQPRAGLSDEDFRRWLKLRINLNRCHGTPEELFGILKLLLGADFQVTMTEHRPKDVVFTFFVPLKISKRIVFSLLQEASPICIKHHFINATTEKPFTLGVSSFAASQFADFFKEDL